MGLTSVTLFSRRLSTVFTVNWQMSHSGVLPTLSCQNKGMGCMPSPPTATLLLFHCHPPRKAFPTLENWRCLRKQIQNKAPLFHNVWISSSTAEGVPTYAQHAQGLHHLLCEERVEGQC